jgi:phytoene desaturase
MAIQLGLSNQVNVSSHATSILPMMDDLYKVLLPDEDEMKWLIYNVPTVTVPELAPLGGSIVELFPAIRQDTPAGDWDEQRKEKIAELAVRALSRLPPIEIAVKRVLSPKEFQNDMHLYQGAIYREPAE